MKNSSIKQLCASSLLLLSSSVLADIVIIVHPSNANAPDASNLKQIFTGKLSSFADGSEAIPLNLTPDSPATTEFNKKVVKKSARQFKSYWSKQLFTGNGTPPKVINSEAEMMKLVASNPNLIGYITAGTEDSSVKVVKQF